MAAPRFTLLDSEGKDFDPFKKPRKRIWLAFYRYSHCPLCRDHLAEVVEQQNKIVAAGGLFIAFFETRAINYRSRPYLNVKVLFPMVMDPEKKLFNLYRTDDNLRSPLHPSVIGAGIKALLRGFPPMKKEGPAGQLPAHFLIREDGSIDTVHYGVHLGHHIPWAKVQNFLGISKSSSQIQSPVEISEAPPPIEEVTKISRQTPRSEEVTKVTNPLPLIEDVTKLSMSPKHSN